MTRVWRTIYYSEAVGATGRTLMSVVEILGESQRNNARDGLTGLLLAHEGWFLQGLEGDRGRIDHLMARLARDRRHKDIVVLAAGEADAGAFADWAMGQVLVTPELASDLENRRLWDLDADAAMNLLERAARRLRGAAPGQKTPADRHEAPGGLPSRA